ncbi:uncharacterized protein ColSpa_01754 [Colletotrichum spaethianum]|uniref:Uncharacterized protein n=1 Tax=Colletotrichum spaethianum TaxID=700344 RepID=A0AA37NYW7_9PEZI|nr:uncharacterized protein ColSpa_01754 [Colletotrichum spaethianum]GKT41573.1 hypothetical protein ColSpa_01754 [Colletotrichum spaethianum]
MPRQRLDPHVSTSKHQHPSAIVIFILSNHTPSVIPDAHVGSAFNILNPCRTGYRKAFNTGKQVVKAD